MKKVLDNIYFGVHYSFTQLQDIQMQAFPNPHLTHQTGMLLRDYFAAKAMQGFLASFDDEISLNQSQSFATVCYALADAMMEARNAAQ
jgi:hypothetical protein